METSRSRISLSLVQEDYQIERRIWTLLFSLHSGGISGDSPYDPRKRWALSRRVTIPMETPARKLSLVGDSPVEVSDL